MDDLFQRAKAVDLYHYMTQELGMKPVRDNSRRAYFLSPKRSESNASMELDKVRNRWSDRGEVGAFGDPIDFVEWLDGCTTHEAAQTLVGKRDIPQYHRPPQEEIEIKEIEVFEDSKKINNPYLIKYLEENRKIPLEIASKYTEQVLFRFASRQHTKYYGIAMRNDAGGFNIRNNWFKGSCKPIGITTIHHMEGAELILMEGFMDWLSYVLLYGEPHVTTIILNSTVFVSMILDLLQGSDKVYAWVDNDPAGDKAIDMMLDNNVEVVDCRDNYKDHNDLNEFVQATIDF